MPFPDERFSRGVEVVPYRYAWAVEGSVLVAGLRGFLIGVVSVDHIGSTAVAGLAAKDCIDVMIEVDDLATGDISDALERRGYRRRPEPWNQAETSYGIVYRKQVYAPPAGARPCNIHVRQRGGRNVRFKVRLAETVTDLAAYGQIKAPAQEILMQSAERWAQDHGWRPAGS